MKKSLAQSVTEGFTLLEMLVVLGIIAIILSVLTVSFSTAQKKSRDAKRKSDVKSLQNALEQYYSACSYTYPTSIPASGISCNGTFIMTGVPVDPKSTTPYPYVTIDPASGGGFKVCANELESESITGFCVQNQQ